MFFLLGTIMFTACKKSPDSTQPGRNSGNYQSGGCTYDYASMADSVGIAHNLGCEYVYNYLYSGIMSNTLDTSSLDTLLGSIRIAVNQFYGSTSISYINSNQPFAISSSNDVIDNFNEIRTFILESRPGRYTLWTPSADSVISDSVKYYLDGLGDIYYDTSKSYAEAISEMQSYKSYTICSGLSDEDKFIVLSAINTGINSMQYWGENEASWAALFSRSAFKTTEIKGRGNSHARNVGAADIGGCVSGAVTCGFAAIFGPIGAAAWFAGTVGGGIGASAGMATYYLCGGG